LNPDAELSDVISFEIASYVAAKRLLARLRPVWDGEIDDGDTVWLVVVELRPRREDLAALLRDVESWVNLWGLRAIRYHVDGRAYILESGHPVWTTAAS
jgi:hypothetical protein